MDIKEVSWAFLEASLQSQGYIDSKLYYNYIYTQFENTEKITKQARYRLACFKKSFELEHGRKLERVKILKQEPMLGVHLKRSAPTIRFRLEYNKSLYAPVDRKKWNKHRTQRKSFYKKRKKEIFHESMQLMRYSDVNNKKTSTLFFIIRCNMVVKSRPVEGKLAQKVLLLNKMQLRRLWYSLERVIRDNDVIYKYNCDKEVFLQWRRYLAVRKKGVGYYWAYSSKMLHYLLLVEAFSVVLAKRESTAKKRVFLKRILDFYSLETYLAVLKRLEDELMADEGCIISVLKYCQYTHIYSYNYIYSCLTKNIYSYSSSYNINSSDRGKRGFVNDDNYIFNKKDLYCSLTSKVLRLGDSYLFFEDGEVSEDVKLGLEEGWTRLIVGQGGKIGEYDLLAFSLGCTEGLSACLAVLRMFRLNRSPKNLSTDTRAFTCRTPLWLLLQDIIPLLNENNKAKLIEYILYYN